MKASRFLAAAAILAAVGSSTAFGQITVDGVRDAAYGAPLWVQTNPTLRDTSPGDTSCDPPDLGGDPAAVTTGMEWSIPLSQIGNPTGEIKLLVMLTSSGYGFMSNQTLPSLPQNSTNLGQTNNVNFQQIAGTQYVTFDVSNTVASAPFIDGTLDAGLYTPLAFQNARTSFGDNTDAGAFIATGSELNGLYAAVHDGRLYIMVTGNAEQNFNKTSIFIDSMPGGQQSLAGNNPDIDFNGLNNMGERTEFLSRTDGQFGGPGSGLTFEAGFEADFWIAVGHGNGGGFGESYPNFANINAADPGDRFGGFVGCFPPVNFDGNPTCGANDPDIRYTYDFSNVDGVQGGACAPGPDSYAPEIFSNGSELNAFYARIDNGRLCLLFTGNFLTNPGAGLGDPLGARKFHVFIDAIDGAGQNQLIELNANINDGTLQGMSRASVFDEDGITFDDGFAPDYWMGVQTLGSPIGMSIDTSLLIADSGVFDPFDPITQIYPASFDKAFVLADGLPVSFDGPFTSPTLSNWAPREAFDDQEIFRDTGVYQPLANLTAGLIQGFINNANTAGVTSTSVAGAADVTTGFEICIDLNELGWNGIDPIKVAAFHASNGGSGGTEIDNQVLGGLPSEYNTASVFEINGSTRGFGGNDNSAGVRFNTIAGQQFVVVPTDSGPVDCLGDIADDFGFTAVDGGGPDGVVDFGDFVALLGLIGPCSGGPGCLGDIADDFGFTAVDGGGPDGVVDFGDFVALLGLIGPCP